MKFFVVSVEFFLAHFLHSVPATEKEWYWTTADHVVEVFTQKIMLIHFLMKDWKRIYQKPDECYYIISVNNKGEVTRLHSHYGFLEHMPIAEIYDVCPEYKGTVSTLALPDEDATIYIGAQLLRELNKKLKEQAESED